MPLRSRFPLTALLLVLATLVGCADPESRSAADGTTPDDRTADAGAAPDSGTEFSPEERRRLEALAQRVTIIRDDYGVPHVYGETDADAVFGLLYAQAEDDFPRVERNYGINMLERVEAPDRLSSMERIDWMGTGSAPATRLQVFADTLAELETKFGDWRTPWGEINRYQRLDGAIEPRFDDAEPSLAIGMASGNWGALASFGAPRRDDVDRLYGRYGNSFVAVVEFGDRVRARTLLAGGQSGDPESPHFDDQAPLYADGRFKEAAYYREDVEARAVRRYHPGGRSR